MGRFSAIDYTSGGNNFASGLQQGLEIGRGIMDAYQRGKKIRKDKERDEALAGAANAQPVQEVTPQAAKLAAEYGVAAQNPDVEAAPGARELYIQAAENELKTGQQHRLGDVTSAQPLTPEQEADARVGLQQQALAKIGDVEGASRLGADRTTRKAAAQRLAMGGIELDQAKTKQADDGLRQQVRDETTDFLRQRATTVDADGKETKRPLDDDDWIAAARFQSDRFLAKGLSDDAQKTRAAMREQQATILKARTEERKRDGGAAIAALKADPNNTKPLSAFYKRHIPDGYAGEVLRDFKTGQYQLVREDGTKGPLMDLPEVIDAVNNLVNPEYGLAWLDQEAKRANIRKDDAYTHRALNWNNRPDRAEKGLTAAQERSNLEIDDAREQIDGLPPEEIRRRIAKTTDTGRENPDYDPTLARAATLANRRKVGEDDQFDTRRSRTPDAGGADRRDIVGRFRADKAMNAYTLGKETPNGIEVLDRGRVIGYYQ